MPKKRTNEEFYNDMEKIHPDFDIDGTYINSTSTIHVKHKTCGYEWDVVAQSLYRCGCPKCGHAIIKTQEEYEKELQQVSPHLQVTGIYQGGAKKISVHNNICGHDYESNANGLLGGSKCPICCSRQVLIGFNDIATVAPWMISLFVNHDDAYKYTVYSQRKVPMKCPDCNYIEDKIIKNVYMQGFCCKVCGDGISYPNKFVRAMLKQLNLDELQFEYSPEWANGKFYDAYFVINSNPYIVEVDGGFHTRETFDGVLQRTIDSDRCKNEMAHENGIDIIRIDAFDSKPDYLIEQIAHSKLNELFNLSLIDWNVCENYATSNLIKNFSKKYQNCRFDIDLQSIANCFDISLSTARRYRKIGIKLGWIIETPEEETLVHSLFSNKGVSSNSVSLYDIGKKFIRNFNSYLSCCKYIKYFFDETIAPKSIKKYIDSGNAYKSFYFESDLLRS